MGVVVLSPNTFCWKMGYVIAEHSSRSHSAEQFGSLYFYINMFISYIYNVLGVLGNTLRLNNSYVFPCSNVMYIPKLVHAL